MSRTTPPLGVHCPGHTGIASLIPHGMGNNLFVPMFAGLNYETTWLTGLRPYPHHNRSLFEPRCEPMHIAGATPNQVILAQPETSHAGVSARITFTVEEPHYLHQWTGDERLGARRIELRMLDVVEALR